VVFKDIETVDLVMKEARWVSLSSFCDSTSVCVCHFMND
jgi:hypothetical protein